VRAEDMAFYRFASKIGGRTISSIKIELDGIFVIKEMVEGLANIDEAAKEVDRLV